MSDGNSPLAIRQERTSDLFCGGFFCPSRSRPSSSPTCSHSAPLAPERCVTFGIYARAADHCRIFRIASPISHALGSPSTELRFTITAITYLVVEIFSKSRGGIMRSISVAVCLLVGCGDHRAMPDARVDASVDAALDASVDAPADVSVDASVDAMLDAPADAPGCTPITRTGSRAVTYQIDPAHTGAQPNDHLALPLCERWRYDAGEPTSYVLVADGRVFVASANLGSGVAHVVALDERTSTLLWTVAITGTAGWVGVAYDEGRVFAVNFDGRLRAIDAATGGAAWEVNLPGQYAFTSSPSALSGTVYVGGAGTGGTLYAVDEGNGSVRWTQSVENGDDSSPAASTDGVFVSYACNQSYGFAPANGALLWHHSGDCEGGGGKTVALSGGRVYTRDFSGDLQLDATNGALLGTYTTSFIPAFTDRTMLTTPMGTLSALPLAGGPPVWTLGTSQGNIVIAPIVVGPHVVVGTSSRVLVLSAVDGSEVSSSPLAGITTPDELSVRPLAGLAAADGMLFVPAGNIIVAY